MADKAKVNIYFDPETMERIKDLMGREYRRSVSGTIVSIVERHLDREQRVKPAAKDEE